MALAQGWDLNKMVFLLYTPISPLIDFELRRNLFETSDINEP